MKSGAMFSPCRRYRYTLWREWGNYERAMFLCLNPSTADETQNDPTIRRCINFAKAWGYGGLWVGNIFAFRATLPQDMKAEKDPIGPENDYYLSLMAEGSGVVIAAWGTHGGYRGRGLDVLGMIPEVSYLRLTKAGYPAHPLYLPANLKPVRFS